MGNLENFQNKQENTIQEALYAKNLREKREGVQKRIDLRQSVESVSSELKEIQKICEKSIYCTPVIQMMDSNIKNKNLRNHQRLLEIEKYALMQDKESIEEAYMIHSKIITKNLKTHRDSLEERIKTEPLYTNKYKAAQKHYPIYLQALEDFKTKLAEYQKAYKQYEKTGEGGEEMDKKTLEMFDFIEGVYEKGDLDYRVLEKK